MNANDITPHWMKTHGYDGLINQLSGCRCKGDNTCLSANCKLAHKDADGELFVPTPEQAHRRLRDVQFTRASECCLCGCHGNQSCGHEPLDQDMGCYMDLDTVGYICPCCLATIETDHAAIPRPDSEDP